MIRTGDILHNPVTGETLIFRKTSRDTDGEAVVVETIVQPDGFVAAAHVHPHQTERFEVIEGRLGLQSFDREIVAAPGEVVTVEPGTPHRFWNAGDRKTRFVCTITPALQFESLIETMFTLAAEGKTNKKGLPNPLRLAVVAREHFETVRSPIPSDPRLSNGRRCLWPRESAARSAASRPWLSRPDARTQGSPPGLTGGDPSRHGSLTRLAQRRSDQAASDQCPGAAAVLPKLVRK